ncbi:MAG: HAMP domain-containing histidine kinase [Hamadaea sp.]|uniref:sensor histidine kinase n=1 Tax=Hamadaea sp. TaxID=2024425 RepID=UPI00179C2C4D|nr:HAMP domain-containing sensor histidine kinase [Hamadaea sp.]NUR69705.1 HAMP domain-containing histidine kinase [Hamadaea sp.]NUT19573.1 HAMP domain-containing histidine kinase [Hamadaea sp.]
MRRLRQPGLRVRVTAAFALGALAISATVAIASFEITRQTLLAGRERSALRAAYFDANVVNAGLGDDDPDVRELLRSLDTGSTRHAIIYRDGDFYARTADAGYTKAVSPDLQTLVGSGQAAVQRVRTDSGAALAIGIPLPDGTRFYIIDSMSELDQTLRVMSLVLALVAAATTAAGAALGAYASRRVLRPMRVVADAARDIAGGDLTARLDPATEPDLERLTTSFNRMVDQLAARLERDRRFAADVSHELRSPLQTLAAAASVLSRRRDQLDTRSAQAASLVADEVDRFQTLVTDLLELARADQPADRRPTEVAELARQVVSRKGFNQALVTAEPGELVWPVDPRRFEQIIANLIDNAVRHGGGPVAVRLGHDDGIGWLEVDDEGPGVPPADRETIFDRFVRGRAANARADTDGTGLGLALVMQHAVAHGGHAYAGDRPGGGARFRVEFSLATDGESA